MLNKIKLHLTDELNDIKETFSNIIIIFFLVFLLATYKDFFGDTFHKYATTIIKEAFTIYLIIGLFCLTPFYFFIWKSMYKIKNRSGTVTKITYTGVLRFVSFNKTIVFWNLSAGLALSMPSPIFYNSPITPMFAITFFLVWLIFSVMTFIIKYCKKSTVELIMFFYALGIIILISLGMLPIPN